MTTDRSGRPDPGTDPTHAARPATAPTEAGSPAAPAVRPSLPSYELGELIGSGGMGEVLLARDPRVGRDIAVKRMRAAGDAEATSRFIREARIQARLEHPAIVPVHEIGQSADGSPYFTMKRVAGTTLAKLMHDEPEARQRLLRAFVDVCMAIEFAHARGVVHRDLKPANIILGEFGEVYVLDWGLARVVAEREGAGSGDIQSLDGVTQAGATLGTPGYMAPEQIRDATSVGAPADAYALGAMLFAILAREPVHPRGMAALANTVAGVEGSPALVRPDLDIPPELDGLCREALALDPARRPSARQLADRVQRYLDGDRDVAQRRVLAAEHLAAARAALAEDDGKRRVEALRLAGSAIALDPESRAATELFARMILDPPGQLPDALRAALAASEIATQQRQSRVATGSFVAVAGFLIAIACTGVRSWPVWSTVAAVTAVMAVVAWSLSKRAPGVTAMMLVVVGNALLASLLSRAFGSLILAPRIPSSSSAAGW